jgi:hypothetical protein
MITSEERVVEDCMEESDATRDDRTVSKRDGLKRQRYKG